MRVVFENPVYLWFLLSIPFLIAAHLFTLKYSRGSALKFSNFEAIARVTGEERLAKPYSGLFMNRNLFMLLLRVLALCFIILAVSTPVLWYTGRTSELDFVLAIDASSSMLANDFLPNRLESAKNAAQMFVDKLPDRVGVGIVSFSGTSFVEMRITEDKVKARQKIMELSVKKVGGTDLGGALVSASNLMLTSSKSKVIIILTDGRSNVGISIDEAIEYLKENDITVHTVGMGTEEGGTFIAEELISTVDEATLKRIADESNGRFYRAEEEEELDNAYAEIAEIEELELPLKLSYVFMIISLVLLFAEWIFVNTRYRIIS